MPTSTVFPAHAIMASTSPPLMPVVHALLAPVGMEFSVLLPVPAPADTSSMMLQDSVSPQLLPAVTTLPSTALLVSALRDIHSSTAIASNVPRALSSMAANVLVLPR